MKYFLRIITFLLICFFLNSNVSGQCDNAIKEETSFGRINIVKSNWQYLVLRGGYSYGIELINNEKGITGIFTSKGGVSLEQDNDVIFMSADNTRKSLQIH